MLKIDIKDVKIFGKLYQLKKEKWLYKLFLKPI